MYHSSPNLAASRHVLLWIARGAAVFMFGFFCLFATGEGLPPVWRQPLGVQLEFIALGAVLIGYALGWHQPAPGGTLVLLGVVAFNAVELVVNGKMAGTAFHLFGIPGVLYLAAWYWSRRKPVA